MTSEQVFVWIWLPDAAEPVVAGALKRQGEKAHFAYGTRYLQRPDAIALFTPELPLRRGEFTPNGPIASCIRDASPDAWGRRVIMHHLLGTHPHDADPADLDEITYLLESGSDRIGALDFQRSATDYEPRNKAAASLEMLSEATTRISAGQSLPPALDLALRHGTSVGGAHPKALIDADERKFIAKFSVSTDLYNVVKAEYIAMQLAALAGIQTASVQLTQAAGRDVLLVERFDRYRQAGQWQRKGMVSALTILALDEMLARYASYELLADEIRHRFTAPRATLHELYRRMLFNLMVGNTDDHARNHAAFWDGQQLTLTPAYDICPQMRTGREASQAMRLHGQQNLSQLTVCFAAAPRFMLSRDEAILMAEQLLDTLIREWPVVCDQAALPAIERAFLWKRQFLNDSIFDGLDASTRRRLSIGSG
ncbi:MAG: HipA domain-containing protein [Candidatus Competibacteraceae bacterium]|nr:HipA domain-containing protein [Candidatus Competibacteraceae bacterium]MCP5126024.1 HipA domain-containing protein [Gammaproteobacteria bacterium]